VSGETDSETSETVPETIERKRRVLLSAGEQTVEVEGPDDIDTIAQLAGYFWLLTSPPQRVIVGFGAGSALVTERAATYQEADREVDPCP
jgi:hypothetical protein